MHTVFDTIPLLWTGTARPTARGLGLILLTAVLVSSTACGGSTADTGDATSTSRATTTTILPAAPTSMSSAPSTTAAPRPTTTIDALIGVPGERVHVRCVGQGDTTVLLISGFGGGAEGWATIEPAIAARARVCSYERPGTGQSDPATSTSTFTTQAMDLHALLGAIGEPGPYIVVGHSFDGAAAVTFASRFADEVAGLVLVDASPTRWPAAICAVPDDGSDAAATLRSVCGMFAPTGNSEHLDAVAAFAEADEIVSLGSLPMAVITAARRGLPADLATAEVDRLNAAWHEGQRHWMALSSDAHLVTVEHTGHHIEIDQPSVVIDAISHLLP
ncbi:MAG: alpha/beta hydrolase [Actinomycetota bacterium]|nr:alpha/beta hydrolase [Actinomycetota bacterium]